MYIIKFINKRDRFSYTNRWFPSSYSGVVYVNKEDFAVVKVVENWEKTVLEKDIKGYEHWFGKFKEKLTFKYEYVSIYSKQKDQKYYASEYFNRSYQERTDLNGNFYNTTFEGLSYLNDYNSSNVEIIEYDNWKKDSAFDRVHYDKAFLETYSKNGQWINIQAE